MCLVLADPLKWWFPIYVPLKIQTKADSYVPFVGTREILLPGGERPPVPPKGENGSLTFPQVGFSRGRGRAFSRFEPGDRKRDSEGGENVLQAQVVA